MPSSQTRGGIFLLVGPDRARKWQRIQAFEQSLGVGEMDQHHLDGSNVRSAQLVAICRQSPAQGAYRLIVVDRAERLTRDCFEALVHYLPSITRAACVVLLSEVPLQTRNPLTSFQKQFNVESFPGSDAPAQKPFALADALGISDAGGALKLLQEQLASGKEPFEILGLVSWQLQRWVNVRRLMDAGYGTDQIAAVLNLRPWQMQRLRAELANRSLEWLQRMLKQCWQTDQDAKTGRAIPQLALEQLVISLCL